MLLWRDLGASQVGLEEAENTGLRDRERVEEWQILVILHISFGKQFLS